MWFYILCILATGRVQRSRFVYSYLWLLSIPLTSFLPLPHLFMEEAVILFSIVRFEWYIYDMSDSVLMPPSRIYIKTYI